MILARKLTNAVKKNVDNIPIDSNLKNTYLNGRICGCSGFFVNKKNGACVYVNTEGSCDSKLSLLYRYAQNPSDFTGYQNRFALDFEDLVYEICKMLSAEVSKYERHHM